MTDGLSEASRALLAAARQGLAPDAAAVKRVRAKVASGGLVAGLGAKLLVLALIAAAGGAALATRHHDRIDAPILDVPVAVEVSHVTVAVAHDEAPPAPAVAVVPRPAKRGIELAREVALIDQATSAAPGAALIILQTYANESRGHGQLAEDAAAIELEARCRLGEDVAGRLAAFDARWPASAQRARVGDVCGLQP